MLLNIGLGKRRHTLLGKDEKGMSDHQETLTIRICGIKASSIEDETLNALKEIGFNCELTYGNPEHWISDSSAPFDCLLVDWRDANSETSTFFLEQSGRFPVIALIDGNRNDYDLNLIDGFNDFVCKEEISLSSFMFRVRRLINRYRDPISVSSANGPEAQLLQTVVNHSTDWLFIKDLSHRFLSVSEEYINTLDHSIHSVIGKNDLEIGFSEEVVLGSEKADWPGFWPQDDNAIENGEPTVETSPYWRVFTGDTRHRRTIRVPLKNHWNEVYGLLVCSEDITTIVKTEQVLQERSEMLTKVTQEKLRADKSREMAELAVTAKDKFIATASHDLRQPLHALGLYLDVLDVKVKGEDERILIKKIKNASTALAVLFNSLLDLSRLDAGIVEVEMAHFPVNQLLLSLREEFKEIANDKSLKIRVDTSDAILYTDAVLLERVLRNLMQNAVTYTSEGEVVVSCILQDKSLRIEISDTGPGILQIEQDAVFSEFYQLEHDGRRPTMGLGLGLAIVRRLVNLLDVPFDLQSEIGEGSVFSLEIPLGVKAEIQDDNVRVPDNDMRGFTVVVIDDDIDILDGMKTLLITYGCEAITAESVDEAIEKLTRDDIVPSMIVADYRLQAGQKGDEAIEKIREEFNSDIPAVIVTGDTSASRLKAATASGFRLLHKPVMADDLLAELKLHLSQE